MRERFCLLGVLLSLFCGFCIREACASEGSAFKVAPVSPGFENYRERVQQGGPLLPRGVDSRGKARGYNPSPVDLSHLRNADYSAYYNSVKRRGDYPAKYDLRDHSLVTPVKNQNSYNTCWAFSAIGSLESAYLKKTGVPLDLSEMHLGYYTFKDAAGFPSGSADVLLNGGYDNMAIATMARWVGPVLTSSAPYNVIPSGDSANYENRLHLQDAFFLSLQLYAERPQPTNDMRKELIMTYGAISASYHSSNEANTFNSDTAAWCNMGLTRGDSDHAALVVGWDDNYPKDNFKEGSRPAADGAWLVKNSWGTNWGQGGYFWLSYEDGSLGDGVVYLPEETSNFDNIYGYDALGWCSSSGGGFDFAWMSNLFTARGPEELKAISFYTTDAGAKYEISVYTDLTDAANPKSGTLVSAQAGSQPFAGYHTVRLDTPVALAKGTKFSVVIKMTTPGYDYPLATESPVTGYSDNAVIEEGASFLSLDGEKWEDGAPIELNVCVKAFTVKSADVEPADPDDPVDPTDPVDPVDPTDPLDPTDPVDPQLGITEKSVLSGNANDWLRRSSQTFGSSKYSVSFSGRIDVTDGPITDLTAATKGLTDVKSFIDGIPRADAPDGRTYYTLTVDGIAADLGKVAFLGLSSFTQENAQYKQTLSPSITIPSGGSGGGGGGCSAAPGGLAFAVLAFWMAERKRKDAR